MGYPNFLKTRPAVLPFYKTYSKDGPNLFRQKEALHRNFLALPLTTNVRKSSYLQSSSTDQGCTGSNCNSNMCHSTQPSEEVTFALLVDETGIRQGHYRAAQFLRKRISLGNGSSSVLHFVKIKIFFPFLAK